MRLSRTEFRKMMEMEYNKSLRQLYNVIREIDLRIEDIGKAVLLACFVYIDSDIHHKDFLCLYRYFYAKEMM